MQFILGGKVALDKSEFEKLQGKGNEYMESIVDSIGIVIHTKDGQSKEIPLEIWQLEVFTMILGLSIKLPDLDNYQMSSKEVYESRMTIYKNAIRDDHYHITSIEG